MGIDPTASRRKHKIVVVTGTNTGVGKTVLTALLVQQLRSRGVNALAIKPFCSGSRSDTRLLKSVQRNVLTEDEITPYFFPEPLTPALAAEMAGRKIPLRDVLEGIRRVARRCDLLLLEGAGGVQAPLGEDYSLIEIIRRLRCRVIIVARNRLGVLNHVLLTIGAVPSGATSAVVLVEERRPDYASQFNAEFLGRVLSGTCVFSMPYLGKNIGTRDRLAAAGKKMEKTLASILNSL